MEYTITNAIAEVYLGSLCILLTEREKKIHAFAFDRSDKNMQECIEANKKVDELRSEIQRKVIDKK